MLTKASLWRRFANKLIDELVNEILLVILLVLIALAIYFSGIKLSPGPKGPAILVLNIFISMLSFVLYYWTFESLTGGRTPSKYLTRTKVTMLDGSKPTRKTFFLRSLGRLIPFDPLSLLLSDDSRAWHDKVSGTMVVNIPRKKIIAPSLD